MGRDSRAAVTSVARLVFAATALAMLIAVAACEDASEPTAPPSSSPTSAASTPARPATPTATSPPTVVATPPATSTPEPTPTATPTATPLPSPTPTPRPTPVPTAAPPRATSTPAQTATPTPEPTSAATPSPTPEATPTATATPSPTPEATPTAAATPSPTPKATPTATATPEPTPTAIATLSPTPHPGVALIEPAPDAFEHHTFETGEDIDWTHGIFVTDPETGLTEGYRIPGAEPGHTYFTRPGGWIVSHDRDGWGLLLDRETGRAWRWPSQGSDLRLVDTSREYVLFEELDGWWAFTGRFFVTNSELEVVARFSIDTKSGHQPHARFSPDGSRIAVSGGNAVYLVPVASARPEVLFGGALADGRAAEVWVSAGLWFNPSQILVVARYRQADSHASTKYHYFTWEGTPQPEQSCPGVPSPDGQYVVRWQGGGRGTSYSGSGPPEDLWSRSTLPWPSVVLIRTDTCTSLLLVDSAYWNQRAARWPSNWLSTSDGVIVGTRDGYAIARITPSPSLTRLPLSRPDGPPDPWPEAAPTGGGRYVGYGPNVYDVAEDRWTGPGETTWGESWWGDTHRERWFTIREFRGGVEHRQILLPPKIQLPPFDDEIALRVAGTGGCLALREEPGTDNPTRECLPDGERLILAEPDTPRDDLRPFHTSIGVVEGAYWVYVRTEQGVEGWVSHDYLEHD